MNAATQNASGRSNPLGTRSIVSARAIIGMEVHVELVAQSKMFSRAASPAASPAASASTGFEGVAAHDREDAAPNTLVDEVVLALPGSLPVINKAALEMAIVVGLALGCSITRSSVWDRKHYTYPDLPKGYQISQLAKPICGEGVLMVPVLDSAGFPDMSQQPHAVRIVRAHLEEDAGKLMHEAPGGDKLGFSIVDYNRAGTALLEIVTAPDIASSDQAVSLGRTLRGICIAVGASQGIMQRGHMRFEPNINCELVLSDGTTVRTPIVEVKNLNSFRSLRGAIEYEVREQPKRYAKDGLVHASGAKTTRGWDDASMVTFVQREKEEAHDYRYMPDPDLPAVHVDDAWLASLRERVPVLPLALYEKFQRMYGLAPKEAFALIDEPADAQRVEAIARAATAFGVAEAKAGKLATTLVLQWERSRHGLEGAVRPAMSIPSSVLGAVAAMRDGGELASQAGDSVLDGLLKDASVDFADCQGEGVRTRAITLVRERAAAAGVLIVRDATQMALWVQQAIEKHPQAAADVRAGKQAAIGRLVGEVVKLAQGKADAAWAREELGKALG